MQAPASLTLSLRDYQTQGVEFVLKAFERGETGVLLADDPGLGKTLETLAVISALDARRVLVIAPAIGRVSWRIEVRKHWPTLFKSTWVPVFSDRPGRHVEILNEVLLVLSYDVFSQPAALKVWGPWLALRRWDLLVLDECQYLKNQSNRTRAIYGGRHRTGMTQGLLGHVDRTLLLSGTPCPNHAAELWPHYNAFWKPYVTHEGKPLSEPDFQERYTRYKDGPYGRQIQGSVNQDRLRDALKEVIIRRRRQDVLKDLPPLQIQDLPLSVPLPPIPQGFETGVRKYMALPIDDVIPAMLQDSVGIGTLRRVLGESKVQAASEWLRDRLNQGVNKIIVFAWHLSVIEGLAEWLMDFNPVTITGSTSPDARMAKVDTFQNNPKARVFIGQTKAAGSAITLTAASEVVMLEPSWVPGENEQAIARAWRLGQSAPVIATFLYIPGSLDHRVMTAFRRKAVELLSLYEADPPTEE